MRDCFDGGLSHLSDDEKAAWIEMKQATRDKKRKRNGAGNSTNNSWYQRRTRTEQANAAVDIDKIRKDVEHQMRVDAQLTQIAEKAEEHGLETDFHPMVKRA